MQVAHIVHAVASMFIIAMFIGHAYMGTIGVTGSWRAMRTGYVDEGWAEEHHQLWADDIAVGKVPAQRSAVAPGRRASRGLNSRGNPDASFHRCCARGEPVRQRRHRQAAAALRRGQGQGRRGGEQGRLDRQGRRLQALQVDGQGRRGLSREAPRARRHRRADPTPACADPGPYVAQVTPAASKPLEASGAHSPPGMATSPPSNKATSAEMTGPRK